MQSGPPGVEHDRNMDVLVLIPAYNEAASLPTVVGELRECCPDLRILIVDDASSDSTPVLVPGLDVWWLRLNNRLGPGGAIRAGLRYAILRGFRTVVRLDGDGQHQAEQIERLLEPIRHGQADAVIGSRYAGQPGYPWGGSRRIGQVILGWVLSRLTGWTVTDPTSGFWAFGPRAVEILSEHHPTGYPEPELLLFMNRNGLRVVEMPILMRDRLAGETSLTLPRIGLALARVLLALLIVPLRSSVRGSTRD